MVKRLPGSVLTITIAMCDSKICHKWINALFCMDIYSYVLYIFCLKEENVLALGNHVFMGVVTCFYLAIHYPG